jgi:hypothetical protein
MICENSGLKRGQEREYRKRARQIEPIIRFIEEEEY